VVGDSIAERICDIISIDVGVTLDGWVADAARTFPVGRIDAEAQELLKGTERSLHAGVAQCRPGQRMGDVSSAIQTAAEAAGLSIVRSLVGHGIGRDMHEDPQIPNYGPAGRGMKLKEGHVLAIEPMVNAGTAATRLLDDGWTVVTADGRRSAHFEHTIAVTDHGPEVLTVPG